jgi:hypothetical protein
MSWAGTLTHGIGIAFDFGGELLYSWRKSIPMTLSSRAGLALRAGQRTGFFPWLGGMLNSDVAPNHTDEAIAADITRDLGGVAQLLKNAKPSDIALAKSLISAIKELH